MTNNHVRGVGIGALCAAWLVCGCGGGTQSRGGAASSNEVSATAVEMNDPPRVSMDAGVPASGDAMAVDSGPPPGPPAAVTFVLHNTGSAELVFSMDKGWQPILFAYSGVPPKAKSILMFPTHCTASCDAVPEERCPTCVEPGTVQEVKAAEKRQVVAPGASLEVPWDTQVFTYKKTRAKRAGRDVRCSCSTTAPVAANSYTVKACGLRLTKSAAESSKLQCAEGSMMFPADGPQRIELIFPNPK